MLVLSFAVGEMPGQTSGGWILRHQRSTGFLWSIASDGSRLVSVGTGGRILSSADGVIWNARASGVSDWLVGVAFGANRFIAVGDNGRILSSPNGETWTIVPNVPTIARLNNVLYAGDRFVAVGESGTALVSTDNGVTWRSGSTGVGGWLRGLAYLVTRTYLFAPNGGGTAGLSTIRGVGESAFVACGQAGKIIMSTDGLVWTEMVSGTTEDLEALTGTYSTTPIYVTGLNHAVAIGANGAVRTYDAPNSYFSGVFPQPYQGPPPTLPNLATWMAGSLGVSSEVRLRGLARAPTSPYYTPILLASGERGIVLLEGRQENSGTSQNLVASVYHGDKFYIVGEDETILQQAGSAYIAQLGNLATRGAAGGSRGTLIGGVSIKGNGPKRVLVRAVGPTLGTFGVAGVMPRPTLVGFDISGRIIATNAGWADQADVATVAQAAGAFPFPPGSLDAALVLTLAPGNYTFQIQPAAGTQNGVALFEAYNAEAPSNTSPRLANLSTRGFVGGDAETLIGGFVVTGTSRSNVLVRGIGPTLGAFGVADAVTDCVISIYRGSQLIATNDDWGANANATQLGFSFLQAGAFELDPASKDSALLLSNLTPGNYTVQLTAKSGTSGTGLIEIYEMP